MATIGKGIRDVIVATGVVGERVYRDLAPEDAELPVVCFYDYLSQKPKLRGDGNQTIAITRMIQVSLFETAEDEDDTILPALITALDNVELPGVENKVICCGVEGVARKFEAEDRIVHTAITLDVTYLV